MCRPASIVLGVVLDDSGSQFTNWNLAHGVHCFDTGRAVSSILIFIWVLDNGQPVAITAQSGIKPTFNGVRCQDQEFPASQPLVEQQHEYEKRAPFRRRI